MENQPMTTPAHETHAGDGPCDICGRIVSREIEHNHDSDRIRGYVCRRCNFLLGTAGDDANLLRKAAEYLENPPRDGSYADAIRARHNAWCKTPEQRKKRAAYMRRYKARKKAGV